MLVSLSQWYGGNSSTFDLGLFAQVAQSWSQGGPPYSRIRGLDVLGEHFSPVLALLGPAWRVWPDPRVVLLVQALALAAAVVLVAWFARGRMGRGVFGLFVGVVLTGYGVLAALTFDFHEVAFAPVFVVAMAIGLRQRRLVWVIIGAVGLLLVKEDLGFTVLAAAGVWWMGDRRHIRSPLLIAGIGVVGLVVAYGTIFSVGHDFSSVYGSRLVADAGGTPWWATIPRRLAPTGAFVVATMIIGLRSPVAWLAMPTLAWRLVSSTESYWTLNYHYDLVLWAVAAVALADRAPSQLRQLGRRRHSLLIVLVTAHLVLGGTRFLGEAPPWAVLAPSPTVAAVELLATHMPPGSTVAAQDRLGSYLVADFDVSALDVKSVQPVRYAILQTVAGGGGLDRAPLCARTALVDQAAESGWRTWTEGPVVLIEFPTLVVPPMRTC